MNVRVISLLAQQESRWSLAGDNLFIDLHLGEDHLSSGQRLSVGTAVLEVTAKPHSGCGKFAERFGKDARAFVNSPLGKSLHLRGIFTQVIQPGLIHVGDTIARI